MVSLKRDSVDGINAGLSMVSAAGSRLRLGRGGVLERYLQTDTDRMQVLQLDGHEAALAAVVPAAGQHHQVRRR